MYEWLEALAYEVEAAGRRAGASRGRALIDTYERGVARLAGTDAGRGLGEWVRSAAGWVGTLPLITWQADLVRARYGIDQLVERVKTLPRDDPMAGLAAVRLAEAIQEVRRDRLALRSVGLLLNPLSGAVSTALRTAGTFGAGEATGDRLLRRAYALAAQRRRQSPEFADAHTLARAYLLAGKPKLAIRFAVEAAGLARRAADALGGADGSGSVGGRLRRAAAAGGASGAVGAVLAPTYDALPPAEQWRRRCGAALVTASWAHLRLGQREASASAAGAAVALGNTMGYLPQAAALPATGKSVGRRQHLIDLVESRDRREYAGVARGDAGTAYHLCVLQTKRAGTLLKSATAAVTRRTG